ncbi:MAG: CDGSH iron-sulfur domain-containing protein [Candidatus Thiodiazotropha sp. (ex Monitilora ramsayi)]|nr:CDGSH iron-sulfur domain-containing protein [Candidatus Thiodiazotropha sp. (ex Monitilora ramsayi)]
MGKKQVFLYRGAEIDVEWDERLCIHIGECGYAKGELFVAGRDPWCQPDLSSLGDVKEIVERCPSGALVYRTKDGQITETATSENTLTVSYQGPYFLKGDLAIEKSPGDMPGVELRAALCRCGLSKNKPFCDNSHEGQFNDYGAVGEAGEPLKETGGKLKITPLKDGPFLLSGNVTIKASSGRAAWQGNNVALCRCGASKNKPFCDGTHKTIGFKTD